MASSDPTQTSPSISLIISTSAPTLDLSLSTPFTITINATLNATHPITFKAPFTPLFHQELFGQDGLTFTNTRTGTQAPRLILHVCGPQNFNDNDLPTEKYKRHWMTLHPDQPYTLCRTLQPTLRKPGCQGWPGMTAEAMIEIQKTQTPVTKWPHVRGLEDGQTYKIGFREGLGVEKWVQGSFEGIMEAREAGTMPELSTDKIPFEVVESAEFTMKRPDNDESLSDLM